ncbi:MAG: hypothetical protein ABIR15_03610 [Chitinophagaceae bacterium]
MPDNQDIPAEQAPLPDKETMPQGTAPPDIPYPQADPETTIGLTQPETADMELHHQPHIHHKKKWKDYLFEFFMLFLAVSAGFLVENQREHYVEHLRAKDYAAMLRKDLSSDTVIMNIISNFRSEQQKRYDSLRNMIDSVPFEKINQQQFVTLASSVGKYLHLIQNNGTIQQLKSSGALRYFKDTALVYTLTSYEEDLKHNEYVQQEEKEYSAEKVTPFKLIHFNNKSIEPGVAGTAPQNFPKEMMIDFDKKTMMQFYNLLDRSAEFNKMLGEPNFTPHKIKAASLIKMLIEEYHLE